MDWQKDFLRAFASCSSAMLSKRRRTKIILHFIIAAGGPFLIEGATMKVAFLGLGIMGRSMAANLVKAGHDVTAWNRSKGKDVSGARMAATPRGAVASAE